MMDVIVDGKIMQREIDYYEVCGTTLPFPQLWLPVPVLNNGETVEYTICGDCYLFSNQGEDGGYNGSF